MYLYIHTYIGDGTIRGGGLQSLIEIYVHV
jgi:hypothetical protein